MIAALAISLVLGTNLYQNIADTKPLARLVAKVREIGQKRTIDVEVGFFLNLVKREVRSHSKFDSEREIQVCEIKDSWKLIFVVPEKPFPEFGKTWVYCFNQDGKIFKAGVAEPRQKFVAITDKEAIKKNTKIEIDYWLKELSIKP